MACVVEHSTHLLHVAFISQERSHVHAFFILNDQKCFFCLQSNYLRLLNQLKYSQRITGNVKTDEK